MNIAICVLTRQALELGIKVRAALLADGIGAENLAVYGTEKLCSDPEVQPYPGGSLASGLPQLFKEKEALICVMATGIVVRCLAPVIQDKRKDPAVVVMDERGRFAISLLSGHIGGANALALSLERLTGAQAVVTTATDVEGVTALDLLAKSMDAWYPDFHKNTVEVNGFLAAGKALGIYWDDPDLEARYAGKLNLKGLTPLKNLEGDLSSFERILLVTEKKHWPSKDIQEGQADDLAALSARFVPLIPRTYVLGMGCKKGKSFQEIRQELDFFLEEENIHPRTIAEIASIDLKKEEEGILALARSLSVDFVSFSAEELRLVSSKYPSSAFVRQVTGVSSVAQAAADLASGGGFVTDKYAHHGVTFALGRKKNC